MEFSGFLEVDVTPHCSATPDRSDPPRYFATTTIRVLGLRSPWRTRTQ